MRTSKLSNIVDFALLDCEVFGNYHGLKCKLEKGKSWSTQSLQQCGFSHVIRCEGNDSKNIQFAHEESACDHVIIFQFRVMVAFATFHALVSIFARQSVRIWIQVNSLSSPHIIPSVISETYYACEALCCIISMASHPSALSTKYQRQKTKRIPMNYRDKPPIRINNHQLLICKCFPETFLIPLFCHVQGHFYLMHLLISEIA